MLGDNYASDWAFLITDYLYPLMMMHSLLWDSCGTCCRLINNCCSVPAKEAVFSVDRWALYNRKLSLLRRNGARRLRSGGFCNWDVEVKWTCNSWSLAVYTLPLHISLSVPFSVLSSVAVDTFVFSRTLVSVDVRVQQVGICAKSVSLLSFMTDAINIVSQNCNAVDTCHLFSCRFPSGLCSQSFEAPAISTRYLWGNKINYRITVLQTSTRHPPCWQNIELQNIVYLDYLYIELWSCSRKHTLFTLAGKLHAPLSP